MHSHRVVNSGTYLGARLWGLHWVNSGEALTLRFLHFIFMLYSRDSLTGNLNT